MKELTKKEQLDAITKGVKEALLTALGVDPENPRDKRDFRHEVRQAIFEGTQKAIQTLAAEDALFEGRSGDEGDALTPPLP
jgi:hypothetical protein